jgi:hypothetical protein
MQAVVEKRTSGCCAWPLRFDTDPQQWVTRRLTCSNPLIASPLHHSLIPQTNPIPGPALEYTRHGRAPPFPQHVFSLLTPSSSRTPLQLNLVDFDQSCQHEVFFYPCAGMSHARTRRCPRRHRHRHVQSALCPRLSQSCRIQHAIVFQPRCSWRPHAWWRFRDDIPTVPSGRHGFPDHSGLVYEHQMCPIPCPYLEAGEVLARAVHGRSGCSSEMGLRDGSSARYSTTNARTNHG